MARSVQTQIKLGVGLTLIVLILNALLSYVATRTLISNDQRVRHTYQVINELEATLSTLKDAETGERGYIITGFGVYLEPYEAAVGQIDDHVRRLKELTADNPTQQASIPLLQGKIADRLDSLKKGIDLRRTGDVDGAHQLIASGVGRQMMDDLRRLINAMEAQENQLLNQRMEESQSSQRYTIFTFVIASLVACIVLLVTATVMISGINARKRAEDDLRAQRQLLQVTLSSIGDGVIACDIHGSVTFLNPVAQLLSGWNQEDAEGKPLSEVFNIVNEETRRTVENPALRALREGTVVGLANHTVLLTKSGKEIPIDDAASPIKSGDGRILGAVLIFRDITGRRKSDEERSRLLAEAEGARERAEMASRAKDEFLAVLSHELRTPLTAVFGWVQLLQGRSIDDSTKARALEVIDRNLRVQTQLIDDLLNVSQIIAGKLQVRREMVEPLEIVQKTVETARPSADAKQIALRLQSDPRVPAISADPARLQQIVWNLLSNAIKFTRKGGSIDVSVRQAASSLQIVVSDTGQGISADFLPQVFNRFSQADASMTRTHGGLGLGLALVRQLVELHGGSVTAESAGIGKGSTFRVSFPLPGVIHGYPAPEKPANPPTGAVLDGIHVLLVEDEPDTREMIAYILKQFGASVAEASSGSEALRESVAAKPNIVISDIGMPDMDGYQLLARIREQTPQPPPVIALTAYAGPGDKERALRSGFKAHMSKPIEPSELVSTVAGLLGRAG